MSNFKDETYNSIIQRLRELRANDNTKKESIPARKTCNTYKTKSNELDCIVMVPDVHSHERDDDSYELFMESLNVLSGECNVTKVIQLGDLLECSEYSAHKQSSVYDEIPSYEEEVEWGVEDFWGRVKKYATDAEYIQLLGNHEDRVTYKVLGEMKCKGNLAKAIYESLMPTEVYKRNGIHAVLPYNTVNPKDKVYNVVSDLFCIHGWSIAANAAQVHLDFMLGAGSIIFGHTHRVQSISTTNALTGRTHSAWSFGSLAKNNMGYQKGTPNKHTNGFGIVRTDGDFYQVNQVLVQNDGNKKMVILPNGRKVSL